MDDVQKKEIAMDRDRLPVEKKIRKISSHSIRFGSRTRRSCSAVLPASAEPGSKIVPWGIYCLIREALDLRKDFETKKNDEEYLMDLESAEGCIMPLAKEYKEIGILPPDWKYDPATAKDFTAIKPSIAKRKDKREFTAVKPFIAKRKDKGASYARDYCCAPPKKPLSMYPNTDDVPLDKLEKGIWKEFQKFDKDTPGLSYFDRNSKRIPIDVENPILRLIGVFAINAFNALIRKHVKREVLQNLYDYEFIECSYIKMKGTNYYFHLIIEAMEDDKLGVYETKVKLKWENGCKSLGKFVLTDRTPCGTRVRHPPSKTYDYPVHLWQEPMSDISTGMRPRSKSLNCVGYDYHTPHRLKIFL